MSRQELVNRAKAILAEAYEEAAEMVMLYVERTGEPLQVLCKEIDPDNWNALRNRVQRAQKAHEAAPDADSRRALHSSRQDQRAARRTLRDPEERRAVIEGLDPEERAELVREAVNVPRPPSEDRDGEAEIWKSVQDAPKQDLSAQAAKFVRIASEVELLLADGAEFKRMDAKELQRLDRDLGRVKDTAERLQEQISAQSKVRRIA